MHIGLIKSLGIKREVNGKQPKLENLEGIQPRLRLLELLRVDGGTELVPNGEAEVLNALIEPRSRAFHI